MAARTGGRHRFDICWWFRSELPCCMYQPHKEAPALLISQLRPRAETATYSEQSKIRNPKIMLSVKRIPRILDTFDLRTPEIVPYTRPLNYCGFISAAAGSGRSRFCCGWVLGTTPLNSVPMLGCTKSTGPRGAMKVLL